MAAAFTHEVMKKLTFAAFALSLAAPAVTSAAEPLAPPVIQKPSAKSTPASATPSAPAAPAPVQAAEQRSAAKSPQDYYSALAAAAANDRGSDPALDKSLITVMSQLVASGRCGEAASLASRDGRAALAARAKQFCQGN